MITVGAGLGTVYCPVVGGGVIGVAVGLATGSDTAAAACTHWLQYFSAIGLEALRMATGFGAGGSEDGSC